MHVRVIMRKNLFKDARSMELSFTIAVHLILGAGGGAAGFGAR
jgi:hypothetical protein